LIAALREGRLGGAAIDVFDVEPTPALRWADVPNILLRPPSRRKHPAEGRDVIERCLANVAAAMDGLPPIDRIVLYQRAKGMTRRGFPKV
jgi:phosphoglycerate dehydrogenase-like enzyme